MRKGLLVLITGTAGIAAFTGSTFALDGGFGGPVINEPAIQTLVPVTGPYQLSGDVFSSPEAMTLYTNTVETGSRFNPGTGGSPLGTGVQQDVTFDDIPIPNARLGGATAVDVTRVTVGIRRGGTAPATDVSLFWSTGTTSVVDPDTELDVPYFPAGTASLAPRATTSFITELVTFGNGTDTLFTAPLNSTLFDGYGTFLLGLQFSNGDLLNGWRITNGSDLNVNVMWIYDTDVTPAEGAFNFGAAPNPAATFYIVVEGTAVPEPASLCVLAGVGALARRRRRN